MSIRSCCRTTCASSGCCTGGVARATTTCSPASCPCCATPALLKPTSIGSWSRTRRGRWRGSPDRTPYCCNQVVAARALQGVAGGAITAAVFAAVPTLFSPASLARIIGLFTGTYGLASIIGPLLGGVITDAVGWRGVFYLNLPIGVVAVLLVARTFNVELKKQGSPRLDYAGAASLIAGLTPLLLVLSLGGHELAWTSAP